MIKPVRTLIIVFIIFSYSFHGFSQTYFEFSCLTDIQTDCNGKYYLELTDIDNDGDKDVLSTSFCGEAIVWHENIDGFGTLGEPNVVDEINGGSYSLDGIDLDNDGDIDIIAVLNFTPLSSGSEIVWYENVDGNGSFGLKNVIQVNQFFARKIISKDIDIDGDLDIIYNRENSKGDCIVLLNNGEEYQEEVLNVDEIASFDLIVEDLDNDGLDDIASIGAKGLFIFKNMGNGLFSPEHKKIDLFSGSSVKAYDLDVDGDLDLVFSSFYDQVSILENNGGLDFSFVATLTLPLGLFSDVIGADIDKNDLVDLCVATDGGMYTVLNSGSLASFTKEDMFFSSENFTPYRIAVQDMDKNGRVDLVGCSIGGNKIGIFRNFSLFTSTSKPIDDTTIFTREGQLHIKTDTKFDELRIFSSSGQLALTSKFKQVSNISSLVNGVYFVHLIGNGHLYSKQVYVAN